MNSSRKRPNPFPRQFLKLAKAVQAQQVAGKNNQHVSEFRILVNDRKREMQIRLEERSKSLYVCSRPYTNLITRIDLFLAKPRTVGHGKLWLKLCNIT